MGRISMLRVRFRVEWPLSSQVVPSSLFRAVCLRSAPPSWPIGFSVYFSVFNSCRLSEFSSLGGRWTGPRGSRTPNVRNGNRKWSNLYNSFQNEIIKVTYGSLTAKSATFGLSVCPPPPSRAIRLIFQLACKSEPPINIHLSGGKVYTTLSNATNKSVAQISSPPRLPWRDTMAPLGVNVFHSTIKKQ